MGDLDNRPEEERAQNFRTRALAALAVRELAGWETPEAAATVIDGWDDNGIDAVAVDQEVPHVWLVQAKWSDNGNASFSQNAALKLRDGLNLLLNAEYDKFNERFQLQSDRIDSAITNPRVRFTLVIALLGDHRLSPTVRRPLEECQEHLNAVSPLLDIRIMGLSDFHRIVRSGIRQPKIDIAATLESCGYMTEPHLAYYGNIPVADVAAWYEEYGNRLFERNIRNSLGLTEVNGSLVQTLCTRPENFWYFNNGLTVLCDSIGRNARSAMTPGGPGHFELAGASVVNGAQTVVGIYEAIKRKPQVARKGRVWIRLISLGHCSDDFSAEITQATNTQNQVTRRDLAVSLDREQTRLQDDFLLSLNKRYAFKRGAEEPAAEDGCSVLEAARALACAHPNPEMAVRAKRDTDLLWESGPKGTYRELFNNKTTAHGVWRSVQLSRAVSAAIKNAVKDLRGRAAMVSSHGDFIIIHLVCRQLGYHRLDAPGLAWESEIADKVPGLTSSSLEWLIHQVDAEFGSSHVISLFKSPERSKVLVEGALAGLRAGGSPPELAQHYKPASRDRSGRKANAVPTLIDSRRVPDGTPLEFRAVSGPERRILGPWIKQDPRRGRATWVNNRSTPLLWEVDGNRYSPSGLAMHMRRLATGETPSAVQGTTRWFIPEEGSLVEVANRTREEEEAG